MERKAVESSVSRGVPLGRQRPPAWGLQVHAPPVRGRRGSTNGTHPLLVVRWMIEQGCACGAAREASIGFFRAAGFDKAFNTLWYIPPAPNPAEIARWITERIMPESSNTNVFAKVEKLALDKIYKSIPLCCELEVDDLQMASISAGMLYSPPFPTIEEFTASNPPTVPNR